MRAFAAFALLAGCALGASISWTGYAGNNQWTTQNNWYPNSVPGPNDDVTITSGTVLCTIATGVNSLTMGTSVQQSANLTIFNEFFIGAGGMSVFENGNLFIQAGLQQVVGTVSISGNLFFVSGTLGGQWTVTRGGNADLNNGGQKGFSGASFTSSGALALSGVVVLNQSSVFTITSSATLNGLVELQTQDSTPVSFDASQGTVTYTGKGTLSFQVPSSLGTFNFQGGNVSIFTSVQFAQSLTIPTGSVVTILGSSTVNLTVGVSGSGSIVCLGSPQGSVVLGNLNFQQGSIVVSGGNVTFATTSSVGWLTIGGGNLFLNAKTSANMLWLNGGIIMGTHSLVGNTTTISSGGLNLNAPFIVGNTATVKTNTIIAYGANGLVSVPAGSTLNVNSQLLLTGPTTNGFSNLGTVNVQAPLTVQNINVAGTGSYAVGAKVTLSSISFNAGTVALSTAGRLTGSNSMLEITAVSASTGVVATFGSYQVTCPKQCNNIDTPALPTSPFNFAPAASVHRRK